MTTKENTIDTINVIVDYLAYARTKDLVQAWNNYCLASGGFDDFIYSYFQFNDLMKELNKTPMEIADMVADVKGVPDYFTLSEYAIEKADVEDDINLWEIAEYAVTHNDDLGVVVIGEILTAEEEENIYE